MRELLHEVAARLTDTFVVMIENQDAPHDGGDCDCDYCLGAGTERGLVLDLLRTANVTLDLGL